MVFIRVVRTLFQSMKCRNREKITQMWNFLEQISLELELYNSTFFNVRNLKSLAIFPLSTYNSRIILASSHFVQLITFIIWRTAMDSVLTLPSLFLLRNVFIQNNQHQIDKQAIIYRLYNIAALSYCLYYIGYMICTIWYGPYHSTWPSKKLAKSHFCRFKTNEYPAISSVDKFWMRCLQNGWISMPARTISLGTKYVCNV